MEKYDIFETNGKLDEVNEKDQTYEMCIDYVKYSGLNLAHVRDDLKNYKMCLEAVRQNGNAIEFVNKQSKTLCFAAIKRTPESIKHIDLKFQTLELCIEMISYNGYRSFENFKNQTPEICLDAVGKNWRILEYVKSQTPEICMKAVKQDGYALRYVNSQTPEICMAAVKRNGRALQYVKDQTPELCLEAVKQDGNALEYVKEQFQTSEICFISLESTRGKSFENIYPSVQDYYMCLEVAKHGRGAINFYRIKDEFKTSELCMLLAENPGYDCVRTLKVLGKDYQTEENCKILVKKGGTHVLKYVVNPTEELTYVAVCNSTYIDNVTVFSDRICLEILRKVGGYIDKIPSEYLTKDLCKVALKSNPYILSSNKIREFLDEEMIYNALKSVGYLLRDNKLFRLATLDLIVHSVMWFKKTEKRPGSHYILSRMLSNLETSIVEEREYKEKVCHVVEDIFKLRKTNGKYKGIYKKGLHYILVYQEMDTEEYWRLLDYLNDNDLELSDIQKKHLSELGIL